MMLNLNTLGLAATIDASGIGAPDYQTILSTLTGYFRQIYGEDAYLEPDSKDGQMLSIFALAMHDANNSAIAVYNSFSPATAQGRALESNVKINGIKKSAASRSTVDVRVTGQVGTIIANGIVRDSSGNSWSLPPTVVIGLNGEVIATATSRIDGAIIALPGEVNAIGTPTRGWQSVTNPAAATPGRAVETDADLRIRQSQSVALPSRTVLDGILGAITSLPGVKRARPYENDSNQPDEHGIPGHSIAIVVDGGDAKAIASTIALKKTPGAGTYGTTSIAVKDKNGMTQNVNFFRKADVAVYAQVELKPLMGYTSDIGEEIKAAIADYINNIAIGEPVRIHRLYLPANLNGAENRATFDLVGLTIGTSPGALSGDNVDIAFNAAAISHNDNIIIKVTI
ncbi:baseplate J/gp47 family protein [Serratia fonticola]|uniref:baseplate J/gp47 family protein n=1 Tax=Serratia fonticola TaxID=47917 RepID=UPI002DBBB610|nr:baseplate J/gp47 family protein [Serratia fonticola]MEB7886293.1 baseplate J/gp47 family protein [Serratia fonticola]